MDNKYFIHRDGQQQGPFSKEELRGFKLPKTTPVWVEGMEDWTIIEQIEELKDLFETKPPPFKKKEYESENLARQHKPDLKVEEKKEEKKKSFLVGFFKVIGFVVVALFLGFLLFNQFASDDAKREFYESVGVDNPAVVDYTIYIELTGSCDKALFGSKWKALGTLTSTHPDKSFSQITIRFHFTDGYEDEKFSKNLNPNNKLPKLWSRNIHGHKNADFEYMEVIDVY